MDKANVSSKGVRSPVVSEDDMAKFQRRDGLVIGIVREAEASFSKSCSLIRIEYGKDGNFVLLMKNNAGFLVGRLVIHDQHGRSVSLVEDDKYTFRVISRFKPAYVQPDSLVREVQCPECQQRVAAGDLPKHLERQHWFPRMLKVEHLPARKPSLPSKKVPFGRVKPEAPLLQRVCPNASRWHEVFKRLVGYAEAHICSPPRPPTPLILAGWGYSNDTEKMTRWRETVEWASANGCAGIVEAIPGSDFYRVANPTTYSIGPMGGPCYRPWDFEAKQRPIDDDLARYLGLLLADWPAIAGADLSETTRPATFTGRKARRLLVEAGGVAAPPWGGWSHRDSDVAMRRTFTRFRSAVNKAISPHEVDHIAFVVIE